MAESSTIPLFANRYRFQRVRDDWDTGRSGFTHLVFDHIEERLGVIKRAELRDHKAVDELKNEVGALVDLRGHGVPDVYDTGEAEYGSKYYYYMIVEYVDAIRVEKRLDSLSATERMEIIHQLFSLLAKAHAMGIVNGDVDLKHLFWRRDKKQLIVIDWGNSKLDVDKRKQHEFSFDLARAAEIVYSIVTLKGQPPASGSIALPINKKDYFSGLSTIPDEFHQLCRWAPRAPVKGSVAPLTAEKLLEVSKNWKNRISPKARRLILSIVLGVFVISTILYLTVFGGIKMIMGIFSETDQTTIVNLTLATPEVPFLTETPATETILTLTPSQIAQSTSISTQSLVPVFTPRPRTYTNALLLFDQSTDPATPCWENNPLLDNTIGFSQREDGNWRFVVDQGRPKDEPVQTSFSACTDVNQVNAIALNVWIPQIDIETELAQGSEFGIFIVDENDQRRDYTIWIDRSEIMHLTVRENNDLVLDEIITIVDSRNLQFIDAFPRKFARLPIQLFFEVNNQGLDIIYLKQGRPQESSEISELDPQSMILLSDNAVFTTFGKLHEIGLVGYGGEIQAIIWPLVFFGE